MSISGTLLSPVGALPPARAWETEELVKVYGAKVIWQKTGGWWGQILEHL